MVPTWINGIFPLPSWFMKGRHATSTSMVLQLRKIFECRTCGNNNAIIRCCSSRWAKRVVSDSTDLIRSQIILHSWHVTLHCVGRGYLCSLGKWTAKANSNNWLTTKLVCQSNAVLRKSQTRMKKRISVKVVCVIGCQSSSMNYAFWGVPTDFRVMNQHYVNADPKYSAINLNQIFHKSKRNWYELSWHWCKLRQKTAEPTQHASRKTRRFRGEFLSLFFPCEVEGKSVASTRAAEGVTNRRN